MSSEQAQTTEVSPGVVASPTEASTPSSPPEEVRATPETSPPAAEAAARWEDAHEAVGGVTRVVVRKVARLPTGQTRVLGESVIEEIPDGAPDWHERFSAARQIPYDRAIDLNGPSLSG